MPTPYESKKVLASGLLKIFIGLGRQSIPLNVKGVRGTRVFPSYLAFTILFLVSNLSVHHITNSMKLNTYTMQLDLANPKVYSFFP